MLHVRQTPYSLSLVAVTQLLAILAADEKRAAQEEKALRNAATDEAAHARPRLPEPESLLN